MRQLSGILSSTEIVNVGNLTKYYCSFLIHAIYFQGEYSQMVLPNDIEHMFEVRVFGFNDASVVSPERPAYPVCI